MKISILAACFAAIIAPKAFACQDQVPCNIGDRSYHVREPSTWDGTSKLPVMLHFHGWGRQGTLIVKHSRISGATAPRNVLLLAPNGTGKTWDFWSSDSRDTTFAVEVLRDAATRYPIDPDNVFISGYSYGSAMAWRFACEAPIKVRALLAVAGTLSPSESCKSAPKQVRHVHGLKDTVLSFPFGPDGDQTYPVMLWRDTLKCSNATNAMTYDTTSKDRFHRTTWTECDNGTKIVLDVHKRGHFIPKGWFARQLDELLTAKN